MENIKGWDGVRDKPGRKKSANAKKTIAGGDAEFRT